MNKYLRQVFYCTAPLLFLIMTGCGGTDFGPMGAISGKVTIDGEPVKEGTKVLFMHPSEGHAGFGITDAAGEYRIEWRKGGTTYDGLPVGNYQVMIVPADYVDVDELSADEMLAGGGDQQATGQIPPKYLRGSTSGLAYEISEGENEIDIDLES
ncbi:MAG: carboxypeptidase-like regulatory domain-containing protein [bacterium]